MINRTKLLADLKVQVRDLESDLRGRFATHAEYKSRLTAEWQAARDAGRTSEAVETWSEAQFTQSAVAWVLACVFVRFCEDNDLLDAPLIAGTDARGQSAVARQEGFYLQNPTASDNDYLRDVFAVASRLPGLSDVMKVQRVLLTAPVSADMGKQLVRFFRATNPDTGALVHDFADPDWNTRFLGDLYQDLSEAARERYALLQTPEFVESFILDRTLTLALDIYTLEEVDLIDPTCGSGHFLLGAFERLAPLWLRKRPDNVNLALQEALDRIAGIDLNPYAVVIARFRLLAAALKMAQVHKLRLAPDFHLHIETGDSLLHGFDQRDYARAQVSLALNTPQENLTTAADHLYRHAFAAEDLTATNQILARKYAAVVGKPIDKGLIYKLINNRTYLGELRHKEQWYPAQHPPIIDHELWDKVHAILATNGRVRGNATRATVPYLLKGIVFGNDGRALSPFHTTKKNGRRYRYYVPQRENKEHAGASGLPRLPAAELESAVLDQLRAVLRSPDLLGDVLPRAIKLDPSLDEAKVTVAMTRLDTIWDQLFPAEQTRIVKLLVEKVIVSPNDLEVRLRANGIERLVLELQPAGAAQLEEA